jgi:ATP-dependent Lon protease
MFALVRAGLSARPRLALSVRAPRWINSKQDTPPPDEPTDSTGDASPPSNPPPSTPGSIAKQSVPEIYPQVLALPIAHRPLFPGFYKAVVVRNPGVVAAIKEMMKRGQPYLGAFLLKDENADSDIIRDINSVHQVGVFAQITSVFSAVGRTEDDKEEGLTAVLYPHRRIKITELVKAGPQVHPQTVQLPTPPPSPSPPDQKSGTFVSYSLFTHNLTITRSSTNRFPAQT